jgi:hypothetical protein
MNSNTETILQKIEQEGEQKIKNIQQKNETLDAETCVNIMKQGAEEFKQTTGRNMTYSEMRNAYG